MYLLLKGGSMKWKVLTWHNLSWFVVYDVCRTAAIPTRLPDRSFSTNCCVCFGILASLCHPPFPSAVTVDKYRTVLACQQQLWNLEKKVLWMWVFLNLNSVCWSPLDSWQACSDLRLHRIVDGFQQIFFKQWCTGDRQQNRHGGSHHIFTGACDVAASGAACARPSVRRTPKDESRRWLCF